MEFAEASHCCPLSNTNSKRKLYPVQATTGTTPPSSDLAAPIKPRACDALFAVRKSKPHQPGGDHQLMRRGHERC
jgi:hypothetical protein